MISQKQIDAMMPIVEKSRADKTRDKKMGYKEGSPADKKADRKQAVAMLKKKAK